MKNLIGVLFILIIVCWEPSINAASTAPNLPVIENQQCGMPTRGLIVCSAYGQRTFYIGLSNGLRNSDGVLNHYYLPARQTVTGVNQYGDIRAQAETFVAHDQSGKHTYILRITSRFETISKRDRFRSAQADLVVDGKFIGKGFQMSAKPTKQ